MRRARGEPREEPQGGTEVELRDQAAVDRAVERVRRALEANGIKADVYGPRLTKQVH